MYASESVVAGNRDYRFFYEGLKSQRLLVKRCGDCAGVLWPPAPMCPQCNSLKLDEYALSGRGQVYSYVVHHHPPLPGFATPHPVVLVDLDEGVRMVGAFVGAELKGPQIGMAVEVEYGHGPEGDLFAFRPAGQA